MTTAVFKPKATPLEALLNKVYEIKFSRHVPLTVVLLSAIYAVYRSHHYLESAFRLPTYVSLPTAVFLELLVIGASAATFIAFRQSYVAELKNEDVELGRIGVRMALTSLAVAFVALLGVAWSDAWLITEDFVASFLMTLAQFVQAAFIVGFIVTSLLDERASLRLEYAEYQQRRIEEVNKAAAEKAKFNANHCPYCFKEVSINNRKRHIDACPSRPTA